MKNKKYIKCDLCYLYKPRKSTIYFKGKYLCYHCRKKGLGYKFMQSANLIGRPIKDLKSFLETTHEGNFYKLGKKDSIHGSLSLPMCMFGQKFKIVLVNEDNQRLLDLIDLKRTKNNNHMGQKN